MSSGDLNHRSTFADKVLLLLLAFVSVYSFAFIREVMPENADVKIEAAGRLLYTLPLSLDKTVEVEGPAGKTVVEIRDSKVRIKESPCANKICLHQGWIRNGAIICLPNRVIVSVSGQPRKQGNELDAISG